MSKVLKRLFDIVASLLGLSILFPLLALAALSVKLNSGTPVFFRQLRVGMHGRRFFLYKFSTMIVGSENICRETQGTNDPRITKIGRFLRRTKIDELPQLLNVFLGDMSLVGPRPEIPFYVDQYAKEDQIVLSVRPGITDPSSLYMANLDEIMENRSHVCPAKYYANNVLPIKLQLQKKYIKEKTFFGDIKIIVDTLIRLLRTNRI